MNIEVKREEFLKLMDLAHKKFESRDNKSLYEVKNKENYFIELSKDIESVTDILIKHSSLYKTYHLNFIKSKKEYENVNERNANGLSEYVHSTRYSQTYIAKPFGKNKNVDYFSIANKPEMPEFPRDSPSFPASPTIPITLTGYDNYKIFIKDESKHSLISNHKSRAAWEIYLHAKKYAEERSAQHLGQKYRASILSSGNFALAIFARLYIQEISFELNIIVDEKVLYSDDPKLSEKRKHLETVCKVADKYSHILKVHPFDIHSTKLDSEKILEITKNKNGFDLTFLDGIKNVKDSYYDWLAYEVISQSPDFLFLPFGSGDLMSNILDVLIDELPKSEEKKSKRYFGRDEDLKKCNFYGMTTKSNYSVFDKLYAPEKFHPADKFMISKGKYHDVGITGEIDILDEADFDRGEIEKYILEAQDIFDENKIKSEKSGIAGLVLFLKMFNDNRDIFDREKVLVINTGVGDWKFLLTDEFDRICREGYLL